MEDQIKKSYNKYLAELFGTEYGEQSIRDNTFAVKHYAEVRRNFTERDTQLTILLVNYINRCIKRIDTNSFFKKIIFWIFAVLLMLFTVMVVYVFYKVDINDVNVETLIALFSVAGTYLVSLISIFRIMSKYLFPVDELKDSIEMIKVLTQKDTYIQQSFFRENKEQNDGG